MTAARKPDLGEGDVVMLSTPEAAGSRTRAASDLAAYMRHDVRGSFHTRALSLATVASPRTSTLSAFTGPVLAKHDAVAYCDRYKLISAVGIHRVVEGEMTERAMTVRRPKCGCKTSSCCLARLVPALRQLFITSRNSDDAIVDYRTVLKNGFTAAKTVPSQVPGAWREVYSQPNRSVVGLAHWTEIRTDDSEPDLSGVARRGLMSLSRRRSDRGSVCTTWPGLDELV